MKLSMLGARITQMGSFMKNNLITGLLLFYYISMCLWIPNTEAFLTIEDNENHENELTDYYEDEPVTRNDYFSVLKRQYYRGWGHRSRFPWKRLPDTMCYREPCKNDRQCCYRWNICDRSAKVCMDCWYGSNCRSERDCCRKYPYCARVWKRSKNGNRYIEGGKCVHKI